MVNASGWNTTQDIGTTLFLSWTPVPNAATYAIYWKLASSSGPWTANSNNLPYVKATNLIPGQLYDCRYIAYRANGTLLTTSASTIGDGQFTPAVPIFEKRHDIGTNCEIGWPDWSNWASSYVLQYKAVGGSTWSMPGHI